jgi:hypothetical protein
MKVAWWMRLGKALVGALVVHKAVIAGGPHSHTSSVLAVAARSLTHQTEHMEKTALKCTPPCARACRSGRLCLRGGGSAAGADGEGKSGGRISLRDVACALQLAAVGAQSAGGAGHRGREGARQSRAESRNGALYLCVCVCVCCECVCVCVCVVRVCVCAYHIYTHIHITLAR